jgi:hypothetical protein
MLNLNRCEIISENCMLLVEGKNYQGNRPPTPSRHEAIVEKRIMTQLTSKMLL